MFPFNDLPTLDDLRDTLSGILSVTYCIAPVATPWAEVSASWSSHPEPRIPRGKERQPYRQRPYINRRLVRILVANGMPRAEAITRASLLT